MAPIATFVFFDIETSGLPAEENNRTRITELSMVAVRRDHILEQGEILKSVPSRTICPRVVNKLTMCFNPRKMISDGASRTTGLTNELLEHQVAFNEQVFCQMDNFLKVLEKPVCLVSHNGMSFDFPILKNHFKKLNVHFSNDLLCADSLYAMYDICEGNEQKTKKEIKSESDGTDDVDKFCPLTSMQAENEVTPRKRKPVSEKRSGIKRKLYYEDNPKPQWSYCVTQIHKRIVGSSTLNAHRAEDDCVLLLEIAVKMGERLIQWFDDNHFLFCNIKPMSPGVRLGD